MEDVQRLYDTALDDWIRAGYVSQDEAMALATVNLEIIDLEGDTLARAIEPDTILLDVNAAGAGWFIETDTDGANDDGIVAGGVDLLTVLRHEIGHLLGLEHNELAIMSEELDVLTRVSVTQTEAPSSGANDAAPAPDTGADDTPTDPVSTGGGKGKKQAALIFDPETGELVDGAEAEQLFASRQAGETVLAGGAIAALASNKLAQVSRVEKIGAQKGPRSTPAKRLARWFRRTA